MEAAEATVELGGGRPAAVLFGVDSLKREMREYGAHFHQERPHQGLGNEVIEPPAGGAVPAECGHVVESERLGGLLRSYRRVA